MGWKVGVCQFRLDLSEVAYSWQENRHLRDDESWQQLGMPSILKSLQATQRPQTGTPLLPRALKKACRCCFIMTFHVASTRACLEGGAGLEWNCGY